MLDLKLLVRYNEFYSVPRSSTLLKVLLIGLPLCDVNMLVNARLSHQAECKQLHNNELQESQVAEIGGGKLPFHTIFLTVLPPYVEESTTAEQVYMTFPEC